MLYFLFISYELRDRAMDFLKFVIFFVVHAFTLCFLISYIMPMCVRLLVFLFPLITCGGALKHILVRAFGLKLPNCLYTR